MIGPQPRPPSRLHPLARRILQLLAGHDDARSIILGGGVALQHYVEHRDTVDLDAWWSRDATAGAPALIERAMRAVAEEQGLTLHLRKLALSGTECFELKDGGRKVFSFQIAPRDIELEPPLPSAWSPVQIETFRENLASKMSALVGRGAPRDLLDVFAACASGFASVEACWELWRLKNPGLDAAQARLAVLEHLSAIEGRRPLDSIADARDQASARILRDWVRRELCQEGRP